MAARDYIEARYPYLVENYDALFHEQFLPQKNKQQVLPPHSPVH